MPGALAECVVRSHLCTEPCRRRRNQSPMHLLWRENTESRTQQFRYKSLALHESGLPAKLRHRSDLPERNQPPDAIEEACVLSAGVRRWQDDQGGVRHSRHLDERRRQLVSEIVCCSEADRPHMSLRQGTAPPGGLSVSARIPDDKGCHLYTL